MCFLKFGLASIIISRSLTRSYIHRHSFSQCSHFDGPLLGLLLFSRLPRSHLTAFTISVAKTSTFCGCLAVTKARLSAKPRIVVSSRTGTASTPLYMIFHNGGPSADPGGTPAVKMYSLGPSSMPPLREIISDKIHQISGKIIASQTPFNSVSRGRFECVFDIHASTAQQPPETIVPFASSLSC